MPVIRDAVILMWRHHNAEYPKDMAQSRTIYSRHQNGRTKIIEIGTIATHRNEKFIFKKFSRCQNDNLQCSQQRQCNHNSTSPRDGHCVPFWKSHVGNNVSAQPWMQCRIRNSPLQMTNTRTAICRKIYFYYDTHINYRHKPHEDSCIIRRNLPSNRMFWLVVVLPLTSSGT